MPELTPLDCEPPTKDVVTKLEEALADAREGKISAIALAVVYRDGSTGGSWSKIHSVATLIGSVGILHDRLCRIINNED